jgi:hypothetical protein
LHKQLLASNFEAQTRWLERDTLLRFFITVNNIDDLLPWNWKPDNPFWELDKVKLVGGYLAAIMNQNKHKMRLFVDIHCPDLILNI